jgi:hypothetical protein
MEVRSTAIELLVSGCAAALCCLGLGAAPKVSYTSVEIWCCFWAACSSFRQHACSNSCSLTVVQEQHIERPSCRVLTAIGAGNILSHVLE